MSGKLNITVSDEVLQKIDEQAAERIERTKALLMERGRPDLVAELSTKLREIALGLDGARNTWHSISEAQRRTLAYMGTGPIRRLSGSRKYMARQPKDLFVCQLPTARKLCAHGLIAVNGGAFDPEKEFVITERGRFVLKHGPEASTLNAGDQG